MAADFKVYGFCEQKQRREVMLKEDIEKALLGPQQNIKDVELLKDTVGYVRKNLWYHGNISGTLSVSKDFVLEPGKYTVSAIVTSSDTDQTVCLIQFNYNDGTNARTYLTKNSRNSKTITLSQRIKSIGFYASTDWTNSQNDTFTFADIQIEKGEVATDYEPYAGDSVKDRLNAIEERCQGIEAEMTTLKNSTTASINKNKNDILALQKQNEILTNWLEVGSTTVPIADQSITSNSVLSFYTSIYGVNPKNVVVRDGVVELTFDAQSEEMEVGVRVDG